MSDCALWWTWHLRFHQNSLLNTDPLFLSVPRSSSPVKIVVGVQVQRISCRMQEYKVNGWFEGTQVEWPDLLMSVSVSFTDVEQHAVGEEEHWAAAFVPWGAPRWGDQRTGVRHQQHASGHHQTAGQSKWVHYNSTHHRSCSWCFYLKPVWKSYVQVPSHIMYMCT